MKIPVKLLSSLGLLRDYEQARALAMAMAVDAPPSQQRRIYEKEMYRFLRDAGLRKVNGKWKLAEVPVSWFERIPAVFYQYYGDSLEEE